VAVVKTNTEKRNARYRLSFESEKNINQINAMATIIIYFRNRVLLSIIEKIDNNINEYAIALNRLIKAN
jgi:hypothetical protein